MKKGIKTGLIVSAAVIGVAAAVAVVLIFTDAFKKVEVRPSDNESEFSSISVSAPQASSETEQSGKEDGSASSKPSVTPSASDKTEDNKETDSSENNESLSSPEVERAELITKVYKLKDRFSTPKPTSGSFYDEKSGMSIPYKVLLPESYHPSKKYPAIVYLHGAGERGNDNSAQLVAIHGMYRENGDLASEAIVYCPQCPNAGWWNIHTDDYENRDSAGALSAALRAFEAIRGRYSIDSERIYVMGYSMGGFGTWSALEYHSDIFAAGAPMCGWGNSNAAGILKNIPIWIHHGTSDPTVSIHSSEVMYSAIKAAGGQLINFTRLEGVGHNAWDPALSDREMFSWLFTQTKSAPTSDYSYIPYFRVVSSSGEVVITEKDVEYLYSDFIFSGDDNTAQTIKLNLSADCAAGLKRSYKKNIGKTFTVYFAGDKLYEYKVIKEPVDDYLSIEGVFTVGNSDDFKRIVSKARN